MKPSDKEFGIIKGDETAIDTLSKADARSASSNLEFKEVAVPVRAEKAEPERALAQ